MPEIIFWKKEFQVWDFESFIFWSKSLYLGDCLVRFTQIFLRRSVMVADIFTSPPTTTHNKKKCFLRPWYNKFILPTPYLSTSLSFITRFSKYACVFFFCFYLVSFYKVAVSSNFTTAVFLWSHIHSVTLCFVCQQGVISVSKYL